MHLADDTWPCPCRSLSDHPASLLESVALCGKQSPSDATRLHAISLVHLTCAEVPQQYHPSLRSSPHSYCGSRSVVSCVLAHVPSSWQDSGLCLGKLGGRPFGFHKQHHTRGYKSLISSAAHQRLERLSQRNEELCQRLSGWCQASCILPCFLPLHCCRFYICGPAIRCTSCTGEAAGALGQQELTSLNVELGESTTVVEAFRSLRSLQVELQDLQSLADGPDEDLRQLAVEEGSSLLAKVPEHKPLQRRLIRIWPLACQNSLLPELLVCSTQGLADKTKKQPVARINELCEDSEMAGDSLSHSACLHSGMSSGCTRHCPQAETSCEPTTRYSRLRRTF